MNYPDFTLLELAVTLEDCDLFWIGCDCATFEQHERMRMIASLLNVDEAE